MDIARVKWTGKRQFIGTDEAGHSVVMDASAQYKGEGSGIRPVEIVLHGLAACTGMDIVSVLEKKRADLRGLDVIVKGTQRESDYPHYYEAVEIEYVVTGYGIDAEAVKRAIELSEEKYCAVKGMLGPQVDVTWSYRIVEERSAGTPLRAEG
jgi:putative redox protein